MRNRTLTNLIADVRRVADIADETDRHPDANIIRELNQSIQAFRLMISQWCDYYVVSNVSLLTVAAGNSVVAGAALGSIARLYGLDVQVAGKWREMYPFSLADRNRYEITDATGVPTYWREAASTSAATRSIDIIVMPTPDAAYNLRPWYLAASTDLVAGADNFDGMLGWEDWPIYDTALRCVTRDAGVNDNFEVLQAELGRIEARIRQEAKNLKVPGASYRRDTRGRRMCVEESNRFKWWDS